MKKIYIARIIIETVTPLAIGNGEKDAMTDQLVAKDANNLPCIPGTALTGLLRHNLLSNEMPADLIDRVFGWQGFADEASFGSRIAISDGVMVGKDGKFLDGLSEIDYSDEFYHQFMNLPVRQHVRITERGAAEKGGKFDNEVVFSGTRFGFEIEFCNDGEPEFLNAWSQIISILNHPFFRIGSGSRKGYGAFKVIECKESKLDLTKHLNQYLQKTSNLNDPFWNAISEIQHSNYANIGNYDEYVLKLTPLDFFLFGSGVESDNADVSFITESTITWDNSIPGFSSQKILIPASSVKGAILHRTAFHYNSIKMVFADKIDGDLPETNNNKAVRCLFGSAEGEKGERGNVLLSDLYLKENKETKLLNHVAIDRFTGGAIAGALFSEEVVYGNAENMEISIIVDKRKITDPDIELSLLKALYDICGGMLPLGGGTMRGHGTFSGSLLKNGKEIYNEN